MEEPLRYEAITGLTEGQLTEPTARVGEIVDGLSSAGRPYALGLFRSVAVVVTLMCKNATQDTLGAFFGVSQPTVSRRWDLLQPAIGQALAEFVVDPKDLAGDATVLVDGTICPTWDWQAIPDLYSGKAGYSGMNIQVAATLDGKLAAVGYTPVHALPAPPTARTSGRPRDLACRFQGGPVNLGILTVLDQRHTVADPLDVAQNCWLLPTAGRPTQL